jgi:hypothetical protein
MATRVFYEGQTIRLSGTFTNAAGTLVDPTAVVITVRDPTGAITTPAVTKDSTGAYHADITATLGDTDQVWAWSMEGHGHEPAARVQRIQSAARPLLDAPLRPVTGMPTATDSA